MKKYAIIVAGGKGERMQAEIPKQFIEIGNKPILMRTLDVFFEYDKELTIIVVLPALQIDTWKSLCVKHNFSVPHQIIEGGHTRFHSVKNGLNTITLPGLVGVHDGVRPLVGKETISRCFEEAKTKKAVIPVTGLIDSIRLVTDTENRALDRNAYKLVQTPQVFHTDLLKKAYEQEYSEKFTDDASVVETIGIPICLTEGNRENIKITTAFDLKIAESLIS